jgi:hypothetical protein
MPMVTGWYNPASADRALPPCPRSPLGLAASYCESAVGSVGSDGGWSESRGPAGGLARRRRHASRQSLRRASSEVSAPTRGALGAVVDGCVAAGLLFITHRLILGAPDDAVKFVYRDIGSPP